MPSFSLLRHSSWVSRAFAWSACALLLCIGSPMANAQLLSGNLFGTVGDEQGSPLPGVTVTLTGTGAPQMQVTDSQGRFRFLSLPLGSYHLRAELEGFAAVEYPNLVISVGRNTEVEVMLTTSVEDVITVTGETPPREDPPIHTGSRVVTGTTGTTGATTGTSTGAASSQGTIPTVSRERTDTAKNYKEIAVFYGTDRFATGSKTPDTAFSRERSRSKSLHLGVCKVSVPPSHQPGMIEEPALWLLRPDPAKHMMLLSREPLSSRSFFKRMQDTLGKSRRKELLVFVHGFNVSFKDAVLRTAQMAADLRIDGVPVVYSWPSEASLLGYMVDSNNAEWTIQHLEPFLWDLSRKSGASAIYLVAHSMGNRPLTRALERIALQLKAASPARPPFRQILLTAPDIDADVFADLAKNFYLAGDRVTLYASSRDVALNISNWVNKYPRAGDSGEGRPVAPNVDIIDVSLIDSSLRGFGHSYYGDNCTVLSDIYRLLREGKPPKLRGLNQIENQGVAYWVIQAASACPP